MINYSKNVEIRWADLDPNFHLRHSVYYDYGASCRIDFLEEQGVTVQFMQQHYFGPIIFREECIFKREIRFGDKVAIDLKLISARKDYSRWTVQHQLIKNDSELAAIITMDGAWIDVEKRKLAIPPVEAQKAFDSMPKGEFFQWLEKS
jgi:acyl-CoA thioester hydrolase